MRLRLRIQYVLKKCSSVEVGCIVFVALMFAIFPIVFLRNFYFSLNQVKLCFLIASEILLAIFLIVGAFNGKSKSKIGNNRKVIITDFLMLGLCVVSVISGFASEFFPDTLGGVTGRYNGVLIMALYAFMYFFLTRFLNHFSESIFILFAASALFVYLLGALNCFSIDIFNAFEDIKDEQKALFISTIGNRNFFSSFICISLPVVTTMFCKVKSNLGFAFYAIVMSAGFFALYCSNSDSGFIGIFAMFACILLFVIKDVKSFRRYFLCLLLLFISGSLFGYIGSASPASILVHSPISNYLINNGTSNIIAICIMFVILLTFIKPVERFVETNVKKLKYVLLGLYIACFAVVVFLFILYSAVDTSSNLNEIGKYFRFSGEWGSFRGSAWIYLISIIPMLSPFQLFFGTGPDTIYQVLLKYYPNELQSGKLLDFDSAHNEYLQYLVTTGIIGVLLYIALIVVVLYYGFKMARKSVYSLVCTLSILCYAVQGFFNISMVSTTPLFFLMITLVAAQYRNNCKIENNDNIKTPLGK